MAKRNRKSRKVRVDFKRNRGARAREGDLTRQWREDEEKLEDTQTGETVRAKGELSRKRTIIEEDEPDAVAESKWLRGVVIRVHGLISYVDDTSGVIWECTTRRVLRTRLIEQRSAVTVGDRVWFSGHREKHDNDPVGVIERVDPRETELCRRERVDERGYSKARRTWRQRAHTIVANADQLLIVASVAEPSLKPHLIDRYIVAALKGGLTPIIAFNKVDLHGEAAETDSDERDTHTVDEIIEDFARIGYRCLRTSVINQTGLDQLRDVLANRMTVLSGQSGVGKSSLLNALEPNLNLRVSEVSEETQKGRHTTTHAELHPLPFGGYVVDTPGIRNFDIWDVEPGELEAYFEEFLPHIPNCRFSDCTHRDETGCAVTAALDAGEISDRRYDSYVKMLHEV